jgi:16S rRNA (guanine966-N2)-methyltransferase
VKIISGSLKGRIVKGYDIIGTRPTMQRVKESLFATIQNHINNSIVLDLFSGTGNYGIEAISNGSKFVYFNDSNPICTKVIKDSLDTFKVNNYQILNLDYMKCLEYLSTKNIKFDLIFLDPPYKDDVISKIINFVIENNLLNKKGLIICELTNNNLLESYNNVSLWKNKKYGDKYIYIYQNNENLSNL